MWSAVAGQTRRDSTGTHMMATMWSTTMYLRHFDAHPRMPCAIRRPIVLYVQKSRNQGGLIVEPSFMMGKCCLLLGEIFLPKWIGDSSMIPQGWHVPLLLVWAGVFSPYITGPFFRMGRACLADTWIAMPKWRRDPLVWALEYLVRMKMKMKTKLLREKAVLNQYVISARVEAFHFSSLSKD